MTELKLTPKMLARVLYEAHAEDVAEKTAAMTEAEKDAALAKMGTSRAALKASLAARRAKYEAEAKAKRKEPSRVAPLSSWRTRILPWAAVLAGVGATGSFATSVAIYQRVASLPMPTFAAPPLAPEERARALRYEALRMLALGNDAQCISDLDEARRLDPAGDGDAALASARRRAEQGLAEQKRTP